MIAVKNEIISFETLKELYGNDVDFGDIWKKFLAKEYLEDYTIKSGCLFKGNSLCIPKTYTEGNDDSRTPQWRIGWSRRQG